MAYKHKSGTIFQKFNSHMEHCFYEETTKREMFLIIEQFATLLKDKIKNGLIRQNLN